MFKEGDGVRCLLNPWDWTVNPPIVTVSVESCPDTAPVPYVTETGWFWLLKELEDEGLNVWVPCAQPCVHWVEAIHRSLDPVSNITLKDWARCEISVGEREEMGSGGPGVPMFNVPEYEESKERSVMETAEEVRRPTEGDGRYFWRTRWAMAAKSSTVARFWCMGDGLRRKGMVTGGTSRGSGRSWACARASNNKAAWVRNKVINMVLEEENEDECTVSYT